MQLKRKYLFIAISGIMIGCASKKQFSLMQWKNGTSLPAAGNQPSIGVAGPVVGIHSDMLIVAGGANFPDSMPWLGGKKKYHNAVHIFLQDKAKGIVHKASSLLPFNIAYSACTSSAEGVVFAGGENEKGISNKAWLLQWRDSIDLVALPDLPKGITNASAAVYESSVYIIGGETDKGASNAFYKLDLNNRLNGWQSLPAALKPVSHAVLLVQQKQGRPFLYLAGGRRKTMEGISELYKSLYEFDLQKQSWSEKRSLPYALSAGTGLAAPHSLLVLFGGDKGETFHKTEMITAAINGEQQESKKQQLVKEKIQIQSTHPGFSNEILVYDVIADRWYAAGQIPFHTPVTTTAVNWNNTAVIPSGEIRAGVRTPHILTSGFDFND